MNREPTFDQSAIEDQLHELAEHLEASTTVYIIGGGALTLQGLKNATRDIDLIVESTEAAERVFDALTAHGYRSIDDPEVEYTDLDAAFILERDSRRFDVFNRQVAGVIHLSEAMKGRGEELLVDGNLTVEMVSLDDIFLFKSVANRANDVDDMIVIAEAGIDVNGIMDEVSRQLEYLGEDHFIGAMKAKLDRLEKRGYSLAIQDRVESLYDSVQLADTVENVLFSVYDAEYRYDDLFVGVPRSRLRERLDTDIELETALNWLERTHRIRTADDDTVVPLRDA